MTHDVNDLTFMFWYNAEYDKRSALDNEINRRMIREG